MIKLVTILHEIQISKGPTPEKVLELWDEVFGNYNSKELNDVGIEHTLIQRDWGRWDWTTPDEATEKGISRDLNFLRSQPPSKLYQYYKELSEKLEQLKKL